MRSRRLVLVAAAPLVWVLADLYFRVDLPGAAHLQHVAFRALSWLPQWLPEGEFRTRNLLIGLAAGAAATGLMGRRGLPVWRAAALLAAGTLLVGAFVALLMERAIGAGILVGGAWVLWRAPRGPRPERSLPRVAASAVGAVAVGAVALLYIHGLFAADSDGYLTLAWVRWLAQTRGGLEGLVLGVALLGGVGAAASVLRRRGGARAYAQGLCGGFAVAAAGVALLDRSAPWLSVLVLVPAGVALLALTRRPSTALGVPGALAPLALVTGLLVAHTYAARVFGCPDAGDLPAGVERIADVGEVFQIAVGEGGRVVAMTHRSERRIGRVEVRPAVGAPGAVDPARIIPAPGQEGMHPTPEPAPESLLPGQTYARPEELLYAPEARRFFGTVLSADPKFYEKTISPQNDVNNMIVAFDGDARAAVRTWWESRQCWVGTLFWDAPRARLLLGCEYEPSLLQLDPSTGEFADGVTDPALGDVAGIAVDTRDGGDALWVVSMWNSPRLTELGANDLQPRRSVTIGSGRYALGFHAPSARLFSTAYYRSRVRILDADSLDPVGSIPTGLGARALAVDDERALVLVSSVYDGIVRVCGTDGRVQRELRVGGHVKDIALDSENGLAYFVSQCGLFRVDLNVMSEGS